MYLILGLNGFTMEIKRMTWNEAFSLSFEYFIYTFIISFIGGFIIGFTSVFSTEIAFLGLIFGYLTFSLGGIAVLVKIISDVLFYSFNSNQNQIIKPINVNRVSLTADPNLNNVTVKCDFCGMSNNPANMHCTGCTQKLNFKY